MIEPPAQVASADCYASYTVRAVRDPQSDTTLRMDYGDGVFEAQTIPQGDGVASLPFTHQFPHTWSPLPPFERRCSGGTAGDDVDEPADSRDPRDALDVTSRGVAYHQVATIVETGRASPEAVTVHP